MTKNILQFDVVHHIRNMMLAWRKRPLPEVGIVCSSGVSHLLIDGPTLLYKAFLSDKQTMPIKLSLFKGKVLSC